jgi:hypothetical protein
MLGASLVGVRTLLGCIVKGEPTLSNCKELAKSDIFPSRTFENQSEG